MSEKRMLTNDVIVTDNVIKQANMETTSYVSKGSKNKGTFVELCPELKHELDWSGTTMKELLHLGAATVLIKLQGNWRSVGTACQAESGKVTNVHEYINRPINRTMRPAEDVLLDKVENGEMSQEALADLIAKLKAKQTS